MIEGERTTLERSNQISENALAEGAPANEHRPLIKHCCCGQDVLIRPLGREGDCRRLSQYFSRLSRNSAHSRLYVLGVPLAARHEQRCRGVSVDESQAATSTEAERGVGRCCECQGVYEYTLIAVIEGPMGDQQVVGEACYVVDPGCEGQAEAAASVADAYQAHGLGRALVAALVEAARARGIKRLAAYVLADNYPASRTFLGLGFRAVLWQPGTLKMVLDLADDGQPQVPAGAKSSPSVEGPSGTFDQLSPIMFNGHAGGASVSQNHRTSRRRRTCKSG
jgi:GNAT superfamily N-acetyltransferase